MITRIVVRDIDPGDFRDCEPYLGSRMVLVTANSVRQIS